MAGLARPLACDRADSAQAPSADGMRVALFSGNYNCVRDGANRALNRLAAHLIARGAIVRVYSPTNRIPAFRPAGELVSVPSIGIPGRSEYRVALGLPRAIRRDVVDFAPTHFHLSCPDLLGMRAAALARSLGVPAIASMHTRFETYPAYYGLDFLAPPIERRQKKFYTRCDRILAPSPHMADILRGYGVAPDRIHIWSRGVDRSVFSPDRHDAAWLRSLGYGADDPILLFFGRLVQEKGLDVFVATMDELQRRGRRLRPLIVGDGPARPWLEERLPEAHFTGHVEGAALGRAVASADILINPSVTEAFGNVNLEAMASGLAIVTADVGASRVLIDDGEQGLLVPPKDPAAYADAVESLIDAPARQRRLGEAAVAASRAYNWTDILDSVVEVYRQA
ncbi:MAG TPA: glycosyltransferase family 1 protein [Allosphingosinicella sp.]|nr:glycosyltransferase family 1 protein [Allosphingosinicella sp.]